MAKKKIVVLFGGVSSEHEISCLSAQTIIHNIDSGKYDVILIGITKEGKWLKADRVESLADGSWVDSRISAVISPDATKKCVILSDGGQTTEVPVDVIFPALHGLYGEDGTVQGLFELAQIPYVGCGVLASAVSMDKLYTKLIVDKLGIRQAAYVPVLKSDFHNMQAILDRVEAKLSYPVFVKPSNAGSSQGVSKADDREGLERALRLALVHDRKILVEETIIGREIECAVLSTGSGVASAAEPMQDRAAASTAEPNQDTVMASGVGEILAAAEFYDYEAKYHNAESKTVISPQLPDGKEEEIRKDAVAIFKSVDGFGLARVDFFLEKDTNEVIFNEINTLPGFTSISMYPMLWGAKGLDKKELLSRLIELAYER